MDHIVVIASSFTKQQDIQVYQKGECKRKLTCPIEDIEKICYGLCKEFKINKISFHGAAFLGEKLQRELNKSKEFNDFEIYVDFV